MKNRLLLLIIVLLVLGVSVSCAGLRMSADAYVVITATPQVAPYPSCEWIRVSTYWKSEWICVPRPTIYRLAPVHPPVVHRPRTAPPSHAVPRPPVGRGRGQQDDHAWLGACDTPDPCPSARARGRIGGDSQK